MGRVPLGELFHFRKIGCDVFGGMWSIVAVHVEQQHVPRPCSICLHLYTHGASHCIYEAGRFAQAKAGLATYCPVEHRLFDWRPCLGE
jgi:hypothetical protein